MSRRTFQFAAVLVLILAALTPLAEFFDHWDTNPNPATDTELHLTAWFAGAGVVLAMAKLLRYTPRLVGAGRPPRRSLRTQPLRRLADTALPEPTISPPPVPLRI